MANKLVERKGLRKDGQEFTVECAAFTMQLNGTPIVTAILRDITDRKRVEGALKESEERYKRITETITDYIFHVRICHEYRTS